MQEDIHHPDSKDNSHSSHGNLVANSSEKSHINVEIVNTGRDPIEASTDHSNHDEFLGVIPKLFEEIDHSAIDHSMKTHEMHDPDGGHDTMEYHVMDGIPTWMGMAGLAIIILASHLLVKSKQTLKTPSTYRTFNVLRIPLLKKLIRLPYFPLLAQSLSILLFLLVISAGLWGNEKGNIGPVLTWTWWWVLLIFLILGMGKAFCTICPWEGISSLITSLSLKSRIKKLGFEFQWPAFAKNIYPAIIFFVLLTWFELGWDVTRSAQTTAILGLVMLGMAVLAAMFFEKRAFCRYGCLVGRVSGLYALFSPVELRAESAEVCSSCKTKDCITGTDTDTGCPTFLFPSKVSENTYCTLCTECVRSCPHENIGINLRPVGTDLFRKTRFQWDEAVLAIVLLSLTSFHGLTMTPHWTRLIDLIRGYSGMGQVLVFSLLMSLMLAAPLLLFLGAAKVSHSFNSAPNVSTSDIFKAFAYSLVPIALFYHLAHNCMHFFLEAPKLFPLLSDPFGWGWNLFGTAGKIYAPLLSLNTIWYLQIACIVGGHIFGVVLADRYAKVVFKGTKKITRRLIPLILMMILYSSFSVWLIMQPMEMRSGM